MENYLIINFNKGAYFKSDNLEEAIEIFNEIQPDNDNYLVFRTDKNYVPNRLLKVKCKGDNNLRVSKEFVGYVFKGFRPLKIIPEGEIEKIVNSWNESLD